MINNKAFTLTELIVTIVIVPTLVCVLAVFCVMQFDLLNSVEDFVTVSREARIAANHMVRILRFAIPSTVTCGAGYIAATIDGGHLDAIPSDKPVRYDLSGDKIIYTPDTAQPGVTSEIAGYITQTGFTPAYAQPNLTISITAAKRKSSISLRTTVRAMGE